MLWKLQCVTVYTFARTAFCDFLVWSEPSSSTHYQYWIAISASLRYHVVALCYGDADALGLQDWPPHVLQQFVDGMNVGVGQLRALALGLGRS